MSNVKFVQETKDQINKIFPQATKIDVNLKRLPNGEYNSLIRVLAPKCREIVAQKRDHDLKRSLEKSYQAVYRQILRAKSKLRKRKLKKDNFLLVA